MSKFLGIEVPSDLKKSNFFFLYLTAFLSSSLMVFPALIQPLFLKEIIGIADERAGSVNSLLQNMSQIASLFLAGYVGYLSDKIGRRIMLLWGFIATGIFFIAFAYSKQIGDAVGIPPEISACALRFLVGVGLIFTWPHFTTLVTDYTFPSSRGRAMAMYGFMMGIGTIIAFGAIGQLPKIIGIYESFYAIVIIALLGWFVARIGVVDRYKCEKKRKVRLREALSLARESASLKASYLVTFVGRADIPIVRVIFMVWLVTEAHNYGYSPAEATGIGGIVMMGFAIMAIFSNIVMGPLVDKLGRIEVIIISMLCVITGFFILFFFENPFTYWIALPIGLMGFGASGEVIAANTLAADSAPKHMVGTVIGGLNTIQSVGIIILLQSAGFIMDAFSMQSAFLFKGIVDIFAFIWILSVRKKCYDESSHKSSEK